MRSPVGVWPKHGQGKEGLVVEYCVLASSAHHAFYGADVDFPSPWGGEDDEGWSECWVPVILGGKRVRFEGAVLWWNLGLEWEPIAWKVSC